MDIQDIRKELERLRGTIQSEIEAFERKTNVFIKSINIDRGTYYEMGGDDPYHKVKIFLEVRL